MRMTELSKYIRTVNDFPKPGIGFKDITTLTKDPIGFKLSIDMMLEKLANVDVELILGIESRGFIFGAALADRMGVGLDLIRKKGKLPGATASETYDLEYGTDSIEIHADSFEKGSKIVIVDDLLATGGTMAASINLVKKLGGEISCVLFLIELGFLKGREKLSADKIISLINYAE
ncbi:MAG: adenine phosphoribosyltransferase [Candidatus Marinimicrobia bacterium]|nr:adenine phosphoribosyltransferase [Candidatus Neomarinimicrobiota bacterium]